MILTRAQVAELVERMLKSSGRRVDISQPFVDAMLPGGHRLHVVLEGSRAAIARHLRRVRSRAADELERQRISAAHIVGLGMGLAYARVIIVVAEG